MVDNKNFEKGAWWAPAMEIFTQVSTWIVVPIIVALVAGKALDGHFGTEPIIFLILVGLSFLFSCVGIVRVIKEYMKKLKDIEKGDTQ